MRGAAVYFGSMLALGGCFTATPATGVRCDPDNPACPSGQMCVAGGDGYVCSTHDGGMTTLDPDASVIEPDAILDAPPNTVTKIYNATIAECASTGVPSPDLCRSLNGNTQLVIDVRDSSTGEPWNAYVKFEIDNALAGKTIKKVILRMVATNAGNAPGPDSGSVFAVQPFSLMSFMMGTVPAKVGGQLAGNQGAVSVNEVVSWTLPATVVTPGSPVYLGLYANDDDGVNYYNIDGQTPPRLIVDAQ